MSGYIKIKDIKNTVNLSLEYIKNKEKTDNGRLISTINCSLNSNIAESQMLQTRQMFDKNSGVKAHHLIQSFKGNDISPDQVHKLGVELAEKLLKENYQVTIATHVNTKDYHNHIIFNSVSMKTGWKFSNNKDKLQEVRYLSNEILKEHNIDLIKNPKIEYENKYRKKGTSFKQMIRNDIDTILEKVNSYDELLVELKKAGYEIKGGKYLSLKKEDYGMNKFCRTYSIGKFYDKQQLIIRIDKKLSRDIYKIVGGSKYSKKEYEKYKMNYIPKTQWRIMHSKSSLVNNIILSLYALDKLVNGTVTEKNTRRNYKAIKEIKRLEAALNNIEKYNIEEKVVIKERIKEFESSNLEDVLLELKEIESTEEKSEKYAEVVEMQLKEKDKEREK